jgi:excisionase family DNA binding protein
MNTEGFWTTNELAKAAGVDGAYVRRALASGRLPGTKIGRDWLIADVAAREWMATRPTRKKRKRT